MAAQKSSQSATSTTTASPLSSSQQEPHSYRITRSRAKANQRPQAQPSVTDQAPVDAPPLSAGVSADAAQPQTQTQSLPPGPSGTPLPASHITQEAHTIRSATSADRSTAHSPQHPSALRDPRSWQSGVKSEDDDAPRPQLDISSPVQPAHPHPHHHHHQQQPQQQYHPPQSELGYQYHPQQQHQAFQESNQFSDVPYLQPGQPPSMGIPMQGVPSYQAPYNPPPPQPTFQRAPVDGPSLLQHQHQHHHVLHHQQPQPYGQFVYQHTSAPSCECPSCGQNPQIASSSPLNGPHDGAHGLAWGGSDPVALGGHDWGYERRANEPNFHGDNKLVSWQPPPPVQPQQQQQPPPPPLSHQPHFEAYPQQPHQHQHHQPMLQQYNPPPHQPGPPPVAPAGPAYQSYPPQGSVARWSNPQFDYGNQPPLYPLPPPPQLGGSPYTTAQGGSSHSPTTSGWPQQQHQPLGPESPTDGPPSPTSVKSDKGGVKHKSRKTWTEVEWKKLTDLADKSKRGDPHADIDWDFVTSGFGGRRCRQGILTVAAKRGLKVSTREARTIGKTRAKSPEDGDTMQS
ncbi:hypothetical protein FRB96_009406 [Tulasnella sp. 330]|nr:hypothetical protein FRB96_009406 [Tulasnella sp. 330]